MALQEIQNMISLNNIMVSQSYSTWIINIRDFSEYLSDIKGCLSEEEIERSNEISVERNKDLFCLRKGITRILISSFLKMTPDELKYDYSIYGKPFISNSSCKNHSFNVSHSKEYLFIGIAKNKEIGVDIEKINSVFNYSLLVESVFSKEEKALFNNYDELNKLYSFYKAWIQKEAISKALGLGISIGFDKFSVDINPRTNDGEYDIYLEELKCSTKVKVKFGKDYFLAVALT
ncbi:4'-phosphopantetheinyl transferase family protein [Wukongibacter sp. M2B1]|uniref:4'-phosphopantetheinyl transferase family protein n=1 Tax=Wukongibacter sp. M2B1 TaxID=3088895 RepID=UPI003D79CE16